MSPIPSAPHRRVEETLQRWAARALDFLPPPVEMTALEPLRAAHAERIFARRAGDVARAHALFLDDAARSPDPAAPYGGNPGLAAIAAIAAEMITELRHEVAHATRGGVLGLAARIDAALPTETMEHLDDPDFDEIRRTISIRTLDRMNRALGSYLRFLDALEPLLASHAATTVLDLASGHGGFPLALAELARARGRDIRVIASDLQPAYLDVGRARAERHGIAGVDFRVVDVYRLGDAIAPGEVDVITCTQSLHHFGAGPLAALVATALRHAPRGILFIDPLRAASRLVGLTALTWLTTWNPDFVHDGMVSVRKSFVPEELRLIARCAPGGDALDAYYLRPGFVVLRSRRPPSTTASRADR